MTELPVAPGRRAILLPGRVTSVRLRIGERSNWHWLGANSQTQELLLNFNIRQHTHVEISYRFIGWHSHRKILDKVQSNMEPHHLQRFRLVPEVFQTYGQSTRVPIQPTALHNRLFIAADSTSAPVSTPQQERYMIP